MTLNLSCAAFTAQGNELNSYNATELICRFINVFQFPVSSDFFAKALKQNKKKKYIFKCFFSVLKISDQMILIFFFLKRNDNVNKSKRSLL